MREILFRGKRKDNKEWVYGNYAFTDTFGGKHCIFQNKAFEYEVDPDTICQYTGLTDKNGSKIWENDIVDIKHYAENAHEVKWGYGGFYIGINGLLCHYNTVCEVIGNIFDNSELVERN